MISTSSYRNSEAVARRSTQYPRARDNQTNTEGVTRPQATVAAPGQQLRRLGNEDTIVRQHIDEPSLPEKKQSWREWLQRKTLRNDILNDVVVSSQLALEQQEAIRALLWNRHETAQERELALWTADPCAMSGFVAALQRALDQEYRDSSRLQGVCRNLLGVLLGEPSTPKAAKSTLRQLYLVNHSDKTGRLTWGSTYAAEQFQVNFEALNVCNRILRDDALAALVFAPPKLKQSVWAKIASFIDELQ